MGELHDKGNKLTTIKKLISLVSLTTENWCIIGSIVCKSERKLDKTTVVLLIVNNCDTKRMNSVVISQCVLDQ